MAGPMIYLEKRLGCPGAAVLYGFFLHPGSVRDGQYGTGERDLGDSVLCVRDPGVCSGGDPCDPCGHRAGRRRTADLSRGGRLVPLSAGLYTAAALAVIILYAGNVPG